jgi:molybdenum cofactor cytidylyltransferase
VIAALVLAAGRSRRMGTPKLLLRLGGRSLLARVIAAARASRCDEVLVVLGEMADRVGREAAVPGVRTVFNPRYREGMGTSVAAGIGALGAGCEAAVVLLGDQPCVGAGEINALIDVYRTTGKPIVASRYGGVVGAPTLIARPLFTEAAGLAGDVGGRPLIQRHPDLVAAVDLPEAASWDVDTPGEFERLRRLVERETPTTLPRGSAPTRRRPRRSGSGDPPRPR